MARSESSLAVDAVVRQMAKTPALKESSRRGRWFIRAVSDVFHYDYVQSSQWNTPDEARFTVNLHVVWPRWEEVWTGRLFTGAHEAAMVAQQLAANPTWLGGRNVAARLDVDVD